MHNEVTVSTMKNPVIAINFGELSLSRETFLAGKEL